MDKTPATWLSGLDVPGFIGSGRGLDYFTDTLLPFVVSFLYLIIISLSLMFLAIGGIKYTMSSGDKEATAKAKATITYAILGLVLALCSFIIIRVLDTFLGINLLNLPKVAYYTGPPSP